ncbi:unnamed protein product, partial [Meganyctiphanes norvegica]
GGPGCGKGTQCERIVATYGYTHLSSGDLLRDEVKSGSERGKALNDIMEKGDLVPLEVVLDLIAEEMLKKVSTSKGFLIDGYPREQAQGVQFEQQILPCTRVLYFDVPDEVLVKRVLNRAKTSGRARVDDNEETIKLRLNTFHKNSEPVIDYYKDKCTQIVALNAPDEVFAEVKKVLDAI